MINKSCPIIFSSEMVKVILEGRKTQTRRIIKPQPDEHHWNRLKDYRLVSALHNTGARLQVRFAHRLNCQEDGVQWIKFPYGQVGDRLWVREIWATSQYFDNRSPSETIGHGLPFWYRADNSVFYTGATDGGKDFMSRGRWRPSIHIPRWASRIMLEIKNIRIERVQDIGEEDVILEGSQIPCSELPKSCQQGAWTERQAFSRIWDSINLKRGHGWETNPWVWVIDFKRLET